MDHMMAYQPILLMCADVLGCKAKVWKRPHLMEFLQTVSKASPAARAPACMGSCKCLPTRFCQSYVSSHEQVAFVLLRRPTNCRI